MVDRLVAFAGCSCFTAAHRPGAAAGATPCRLNGLGALGKWLFWLRPFVRFGAGRVHSSQGGADVTQTIRLAHLSDVHLPFHGGTGWRHLNIKRTLGWLNWLRKRQFVHRWQALEAMAADVKAQAPDHILVSGDLVNIGLPREYDAALEWLNVLGSPDKVSLVPGNHDAYVMAEAREGIRLWAQYMESDAFGLTLAAYARAGALGEARDLREAFPYVRRVGPVAIIGLNSGVATRPGSAIGELGVGQLERLRKLLAALREMGLFRLVMIHHPPLVSLAPADRALRDAGSLEAILREEGAGLVIHGHNHVMSSAGHGGVRVEGVASASAWRTYKSEPRARYNLISICPSGDAGGFHIEIETRGLGMAGATVERIAQHQFDVHSAGSEVQNKGKRG